MRPGGRREHVVRELLPELVRGRRSFAELRKAPLLSHLRGRLDWKQQQALDREAPERSDGPFRRFSVCIPSLHLLYFFLEVTGVDFQVGRTRTGGSPGGRGEKGRA